jgi:hypothetical protein
MIDSSLFTFLATTPGYSVQEGKIDFDRVTPWLWFRRSSTEQERLLSGALCDNFISTFDVEMVDTDIDAVQAACDTLKTDLQTIPPGTVVGNTFCQAVIVADANDDYIPRTVLDTDTGLHVCLFQIKVYHRA